MKEIIKATKLQKDAQKLIYHLGQCKYHPSKKIEDPLREVKKEYQSIVKDIIEQSKNPERVMLFNNHVVGEAEKAHVPYKTIYDTFGLLKIEKRENW